MDVNSLARRLMESKTGRMVTNAYLNSRWYQEEFFFRSMWFLKSNNIQGDYLEFGCYEGATFALAYKYMCLAKLNMRLFAFDSFRGYPKPVTSNVESSDLMGINAVSVERFKKILEKRGMKATDYTIVPGFYAESLKEGPHKLGLQSAAFVYIDCVLYESTVPVLNFILPLLQTGTIIALDDFYCYKGDPERGEQLAMKEFLQRNPQITLNDYLNIGWHGKSFIVKKSQ